MPNEALRSIVEAPWSALLTVLIAGMMALPAVAWTQTTPTACTPYLLLGRDVVPLGPPDTITRRIRATVRASISPRELFVIDDRAIAGTLEGTDGPPTPATSADPKDALPPRLMSGGKDARYFIEAWIKARNRHRFGEDRTGVRSGPHPVVIVGSRPLRVHRHLRAIQASMAYTPTKPGI